MVIAGLIAFAGFVATTSASSKHHGSEAGVVALDMYAQGDVVDVLTVISAKGSLELRHRRSRDGGARWDEERLLPVEPAAIHGAHRGSDPQIASAGDRLVAVWTRPGTSPWGSGPLATAVSRDGGRTWTPGPNPADDGSTAGHGYADLEVDAAGAFHLVWLDSRDGGQGLRTSVSRDGGVSWATNRTADSRTCECCWNRVGSPGAGKVWVLYRDDDPRDMAVAVSEDGGRSWERRGAAGAFAWSFQGCPHVGGGMAFDRDMAHALVWTGVEGREGLYVIGSRDGGRNWTVPVGLPAPGARLGDLAAAGKTLAAAWQDPGKGSIVAATSSDGGKSWAPPRRLSEPQATGSHPLVRPVGRGRFLVAWTERIGEAPLRWTAAPLVSP